MLRKTHLLAAAIAASLAAPGAYATNGMFSHAYGTKSKGLAGATTALPQDAMAGATNPAGMVYVGNRLDQGAALFNPNREFSSKRDLGIGLAPSLTTRESGKNWFLIPHLGYNRMLDEDTAVGLTMYGNGGMNSDYRTEGRPIVPFNLLLARGPFGDKRANIDLSQLFITFNYATKISDSIAVGVSPVAAIQRFRAKGLTRFRAFTSDAWNAPGILPHAPFAEALDDNGYDWSFGGGLKAGVQVDLTPQFSVGASYQTKMYMSHFDEYNDLFAENGKFDIPATASIGLAYKATPDHTFSLDLQQIFYGDVPTMANPSTDRLIGCILGKLVLQGNDCFLGGDNGAGFGWNDMTVIKVGWQWVMSDRTTLRLGYSHGNQPIGSRDVVFNILAPGVIDDHITAGLTRKLGENNEISASLGYAMANDVEGRNPFGFGSERIEIAMNQWDLEISWAWKF